MAKKTTSKNSKELSEEEKKKRLLEELTNAASSYKAVPVDLSRSASEEIEAGLVPQASSNPDAVDYARRASLNSYNTDQEVGQYQYQKLANDYLTLLKERQKERKAELERDGNSIFLNSGGLSANPRENVRPITPDKTSPSDAVSARLLGATPEIRKKAQLQYLQEKAAKNKDRTAQIVASGPDAAYRQFVRDSVIEGRPDTSAPILEAKPEAEASAQRAREKALQMFQTQLSPMESLGYGAESTGAGLASGVLNPLRWVGSNLYNAGSFITSLGGLAPNKVSDFLKEQAASYYDKSSPFSAVDNWNRSIEERYGDRASGLQKRLAGLEESGAAMLPSIVAGNAAGASGASELAQKLIQNGWFGAQAAAGSTQEALQESADFDRANAFGILSGTLEVATENLAGAIPGFDSEAFLTKALSKSGKIAPVISKLADVLGEGVEEVISEVATPVIKRITYDPSAQYATAGELAEAFIGGVALSLVMEGGAKVAELGLNAEEKISDRIAQNKATRNSDIGKKFPFEVKEADNIYPYTVKNIDNTYPFTVDETRPVPPTYATRKAEGTEDEFSMPDSYLKDSMEDVFRERSEVPTPAYSEEVSDYTDDVPDDTGFDDKAKPQMPEPPSARFAEREDTASMPVLSTEEDPLMKLARETVKPKTEPLTEVPESVTMSEKPLEAIPTETPKTPIVTTTETPSAQTVTESQRPIHNVSTETVENSVSHAKNSEGTPIQKASKGIYNLIQDCLSENARFYGKDIFKICDEAWGGTQGQGKYTVKDAYDAMELAINHHLVEDSAVKASNGDAQTAVKTVQSLQSFMDTVATETNRTEDQNVFQQFSTPPTIAYLAAWAANITAEDTVLEPSAGIGGLALFAKSWGAKTIVNEYDPRRLEFIKDMGFDTTMNEDGMHIADILPDDAGVSVVVMNPPFSSDSGKTSRRNNTMNATKHIESALAALPDGGRLVAILGKGMADNAPAFKNWWAKMKSENNVLANISIDGANYRKYGTTYGVQLVVMDKGGKTENTLTGTFKNLTDIPSALEGIRNARQHDVAGVQQSRTEQGTVQAPQEVGTARESGRQSEEGSRPVSGSGNRIPQSGLPGGVRAGGGTPVSTVGGSTTEGTGELTERSGGLLQSSGRSGRSGAGVRGGRGNDSQSRGSVGNGGERTGRGNAEGTEPSGKTATASGGSEQQSAPVLTETPETEGQTKVKPKSKTAKKAEKPEDIEKNVNKVFAEYRPSKFHLDGAKPHPGKLVESAAMAAVSLPDIKYKLHLPDSLTKTGELSDAQLENIAYASSSFNQKLPDGSARGFFIGDGTGVGKGRQIAGTILENMLATGQDKAVWVSVGWNLLPDAQRDWSAMGRSAKEVFEYTKLKGKNAPQKGILFSTYYTLAHNASTDHKNLDRLIDYLGKDFNGVIVFDEAHRMGNGGDFYEDSDGKIHKSRGGTDIALAGYMLQKALPNARILYCSATGATEVKNLAYAERLGLWGQGTEFANAGSFVASVEKGGVASMEVVARDMKAMGVYNARSISVEDVEYDRVTHTLTPEQHYQYDTFCKAWQSIFSHVDDAITAIGGNPNDAKLRSNFVSSVYGVQQNFYNQILTTMSLPTVFKSIRKNLADGESVVIQMTDTGAAALEKALSKKVENDESLEDLDMTPRDAMVNWVENSFPIFLMEEVEDDSGNVKWEQVKGKDGKPVVSKSALAKKAELLAELNDIAFPDSPLDMIINEFGEANVAEVTGRNKRLIRDRDTGKRVLQTRSKNMGVADAEAFQNGSKRILVFSKAGGTGKSYHADKKAKNQQRRNLYVLQPGWNAADALQGLGRVNRTNQVSSPKIHLVCTDALGQKRFVTTIAKRLEQLGALTKGQRQSTEGLFSAADNMESPLAQAALQAYYPTIPDNILEQMGVLKDVQNETSGKPSKKRFGDVTRNVPRFLNRILALPVESQNEVFSGFATALEQAQAIAKERGELDLGLENRFVETASVTDEKLLNTSADGAKSNLITLECQVKPTIISYERITSRYSFEKMVRDEDGNVWAWQSAADATDKYGRTSKRFTVSSPISGKSRTRNLTAENKKKYTDIPKDEWKDAWEAAIKATPKTIKETKYMVTGALLPIWRRIENIGSRTSVQRVVSSNGETWLGRVFTRTESEQILNQFGISDELNAQKVSTEDAWSHLMQDGKINVYPNYFLEKVRVSGESRIELTGTNLNYLVNGSEVKDGFLTEFVSGRKRIFLKDNADGRAALEKILNAGDVTLRDEDWRTVNYDLSTETSTQDRWKGTKSSEADGKKKGEVLSPNEIVLKIAQSFGIPVTKGHIQLGRNARGEYHPNEKTIRLKEANNIPTLAHELGHHLDDTLNIIDSLDSSVVTELINGLSDASRKAYEKEGEKTLAGEGFAEFMRAYLQDKSKAESIFPQMYERFDGFLDNKLRETVNELAEAVSSYYSFAEESAEASIHMVDEKAPDFRTLREKLADKYHTFYQKVFDSNHAIHRFSEAAGNKTPYILATNSAYADAVAYNVITRPALTDIHGKKVAPGLSYALEGIDMGNKEQYKAFGEYLICRHGPERLREGMRVFANDRQNTEDWMNARVHELDKEHPEFKQAAERLDAFQSTFLRTWGVDTGLVSEKLYNKLQERWKYYVPLNRELPKKGSSAKGKKGFANQNSTLKRARGSGYDLRHPVDNIIINANVMINAAIRNQVMQSIAKMADDMGSLGAFLERVPTPRVKKASISTENELERLKKALEESDLDSASAIEAMEIIEGAMSETLEQYGKRNARGNEITVLVKGEPVYYQVNDPELMESLCSLSPSSRSAVASAIGHVHRLITANITGNNIVWSIFSNGPRDFVTALVYRPNLKASLVKGIFDAYKNTLRKAGNEDPLYQEYLAMGGGKTSKMTTDRNLIRSARQKLISARNKKQYFNPINILDAASDTIEMGPRYAAYKQSRLAGLTPEEAFYNSAEITTNFRRGGSTSRELNKFIPFYNASVQGVDRFARWITAEDVNPKNRGKACGARVAGMVTVSAILALLIHAVNHRDDESEEAYFQLSNYQKNNYWNFALKDRKFISITKPRELAAITSAMERGLEMVDDKKKLREAYGDFPEYLADVMLPNVVSDIAQFPWKGFPVFADAITGLGIFGTVANISANRDFLGKPIVSKSIETRQSPEEYDRRTSKIAVRLGRALNQSPMMIDYFFSQTLGGIWKYQKALFPVGEEHKDWTLGVKNSYVKDSLYSNDWVNEAYDVTETFAGAHTTYPDDINYTIGYKWSSLSTDFYGKFAKLEKDLPETEKNRALRQSVLSSLYEMTKNMYNHLRSPEQLELEKLAYATNSVELFPSVMEPEIVVKTGGTDKYGDANKKTYHLTASQYYDFQTTYNSEYYDRVIPILAECETDEERVAAEKSVRAAKKSAKEEAERQILAKVMGVKVSEVVPQGETEAKRYNNMTDNGVSTDYASEAIAAMSELEPEEGKDSVSAVQNWAAIALSIDDDEAAYKAISSVMTEDSQRKRLTDAYKNGASPEVYTQMLLELPKYDADYDPENGHSYNTREKAESLAESDLSDKEILGMAAAYWGSEMTTETGKPSTFAKLKSAVSAGLSAQSAVDLMSDVGELDQFLKYTDSGVSASNAADLARAYDKLEPEKGKDSVSDLQKWKSVINTVSGDKQQAKALGGVMTDEQYNKFKAGYDTGMKASSYIKYKSILPNFDSEKEGESGHGSYKIEEYTAAIRSMSGLSNTERAILWQLENGKKSAKNNPFSVAVGNQVISNWKSYSRK